jgi:hypothetical protein
MTPSTQDPFATFKANRQYVEALLEGKLVVFRAITPDNALTWQKVYKVGLLLLGAKECYGT